MLKPSKALSERELEVLQLLVTGATNRQIAHELSLSINTIKVHLRNIFTKLAVESRTEATLVAIREGLVIVQASEQDPDQVEPAAAPVPPLVLPAEPALPWPKRLALVTAMTLVIIVSWITWPRNESSAKQTQSTKPQMPISLNTDCSPSLPNENGEPRWHLLTPMTVPRSFLALVATRDRQLVAIGGYTSGGVSSAVEIYHITGDRWTQGANKPTAVANIAAALIDDKIYVPGGYTADEQPTDVLEVYDLASDTWSQAAPLPIPLHAFALTTFQDRLYVFGGESKRGLIDSTFIYEPGADTWDQAAPMPIMQSRAAAATLGEQIYIVGGHNGEQEYKVCQVYNPIQDDWKQCDSLGVARGGLGLAAIGDQLFAIGGGWNNYLGFGEQYDLIDKSWRPFVTPGINQWHSLAVAANITDLYAVGGWCEGHLNILVQYKVLPYSIFVPTTRP